MELHPLFVHFPVALFSLAFIFELIERFKENYFKNSSLLFLLFSVLFSLFAVQTGNLDAQALSLTGEVKVILERHQSSANFSLFLFSLIFMLKLYMFLKRKKTSKLMLLALFALYFLGLFFIYRTVYLGMKLVFEHGAGVKLN